MPPVFGVIILLGAVFFAIFGSDGSSHAFLHYNEYIVVLGMTIGYFLVSNPRSFQLELIHRISRLIRTKSNSKANYIELLISMLEFFRFSQSNTQQDVERHIENPEDSPLFRKNATLLYNRDIQAFFCDYFRLIVLGFDNPYEVESMMNDRIGEMRQNNEKIYGAINKLADALPGIGLVAAIMGMIMALASAGDDAAILAAKIAGAMVGTFLGIFLSYAVFSPLSNYLDAAMENDMKNIECVKLAVLAYMRGHPPSICIEFARQIIPAAVRPSFHEIELAIDESSTK